MRSSDIPTTAHKIRIEKFSNFAITQYIFAEYLWPNAFLVMKINCCNNVIRCCKNNYYVELTFKKESIFNTQWFSGDNWTTKSFLYNFIKSHRSEMRTRIFSAVSHDEFFIELNQGSTFITNFLRHWKMFLMNK